MMVALILWLLIPTCIVILIIKKEKKLLYILLLVLLINLLVVFLFSQGVDASIKPYIEIAKSYNEVFASNRNIEIMTIQQAQERVYWLKFYSQKMRTRIHPDRLWKDAFFIVLHETGFVNYKSLDYGKSLGWISMRKTTIDMLNRILNFPEVSYNEVLKSDRLQAKYIIGYLAWMNFRGDRHLSIIQYNKGQNYSNFTGSEVYYQSVIDLIKKYEGR